MLLLLQKYMRKELYFAATMFELCNGSNNKNTNNNNNKKVPIFLGEYLIFCSSFNFPTVQKLLPPSFLLCYILLSEKC